MAIVFTDYDHVTGIQSLVHKDGTKTVIEKKYDAEPFIEAAKAMRCESDGKQWGEMRHVGFVPMAELATMMRQDGGLDQKRAMEWIKENPKFCTFEKLLKK